MTAEPKKITAVCYVSDEMLHPKQPPLSWWSRVILRRKPMSDEQWDEHLRRSDAMFRDFNGLISDAFARSFDQADAS